MALELDYKRWNNILSSEGDLYNEFIEKAEEEYADDKESLNQLLEKYSNQVGYEGTTTEVETIEDFKSEMKIIGGFEILEGSENV